MLLRVIAPPALGLAAAAFAVFPATSGELPKEGTIQTRSNILFENTETQVGVRGGSIGVGEGSGDLDTDWGHGETRAMKEHCFELTAAKDRKNVAQLMYCIDTDQDGDQLVWKFVPEDLEYPAFESNGSSEIVMGSGKYAGLDGKGRIFCRYGGTLKEWRAFCKNDSSFKFQ